MIIWCRAEDRIQQGVVLLRVVTDIRTPVRQRRKAILIGVFKSNSPYRLILIAEQHLWILVTFAIGIVCLRNIIDRTDSEEWQLILRAQPVVCLASEIPIFGDEVCPKGFEQKIEIASTRGENKRAIIRTEGPFKIQAKLRGRDCCLPP